MFELIVSVATSNESALLIFLLDNRMYDLVASFILALISIVVV